MVLVVERVVWVHLRMLIVAALRRHHFILLFVHIELGVVHSITARLRAHGVVI